MKEFIPVITSLAASIIAIVSLFISWKLKNSSDERARLIGIEKEQRDKMEQLYTDVFVLYEQAIRQVKQNKEFSLVREFSETNARIHLLAPIQIGSQYFIVASSLETWSQLHNMATLPQEKIGNGTYTIISAPDPTAKYREPANAAYETFQEELNKLIELMRIEVYQCKKY